MKSRPSTTPLEDWLEGWLVLEVASLLDEPMYIIWSQSEQKAKGLPSTREERLEFIRERRIQGGEGQAAGPPDRA